MNLLDQLELFALDAGKGRVSQRDFWLFVYKSMESGQLMTRAMGEHIQYKLRSLGVEPSVMRTHRGRLRD
jgi:hypothetical protein